MVGWGIGSPSQSCFADLAPARRILIIVGFGVEGFGLVLVLDLVLVSFGKHFEVVELGVSVWFVNGCIF